jgi:hypothetical protein
MSRNHVVLGLALVALLVLAPASARAVLVAEYAYDGATLPAYPVSALQGWSVFGVNGTDVTLNNNVTDNALTFSDSDGGSPFFIKNIAPADYSGDWTLTARARMDSANGIASWVLIAVMGPNFWNIWLDGSGTNQVYTYNDAVSPGIYTLASVPNMSTAFHKYQLVGNGGINAPELWVDGVPTGFFAGRETVPGNTTSSVQWGANWSGSTTGVSNWQLVRFNSDLSQIPEPAGLSLLTLGGIALLRRRR